MKDKKKRIFGCGCAARHVRRMPALSEVEGTLIETSCATYKRITKQTYCSTIVENVRQIRLFLQNKANLYMAKIAVSSYVTSKYEKSTIL